MCILHYELCIAALAAFAASAVPPLFDNGGTEWKVVVAPDASPVIRYAAEEFTNAVAAVSGVAIPVVSSDEGVEHAVRISADKEEWAKERVVYRLEGGDLLFTGNQSRAALHATYAFLDRELGVRWLWPGEDGAFFPARRKWEFPKEFGFDYTPAIWFRGFHHCGDWRDRANFLVWETRNYVNIHRHGNGRREVKYGHYSMPSGHNANLNGEKKLFEEHPECFSLLGGHRSMANICFSSDLGAQKVAGRIGAEIERRVKQAPVDIISIFPSDNMDYCQCPDCKAKGVSNGWFEYFGKVVAILRRRFPELRFSTIAYQGYLDPPDCRFDGVEFVEYASHPRCHIHKWDDPDCPSNASELKRLKAWCTRGDVAVGHYAYEYDAVSAHPIFLPFFSMVGDAVEKAAELGLVTQIPEVVLSPNTGPDVRAFSVQNRLTILYYARKMWNPSLTLEAFLDDLCRTAFGRAARPMKEYYLLCDELWAAQEGRLSLFVDGMNVSAALLSDDKKRERAAKLLEEAEALVASGDVRSLGNVRREKELYGQWVDYRELRLGTGASVKLPKVEPGERLVRDGAPKLALMKGKDKEGQIKVSGHWTPKTEIVFEVSGAAEAEITLVDAYSERYVFKFKNGEKTQKRISDVGVEMATWQPEWTAQVVDGGKGLIIRLPAKAFGHEPAAKEQWGVRFVAGGESYPLRDDMTAKLRLLAAPAAERPIVYYVGDKRRFAGIPGLRVQAEDDGWRLIPCTNSAELAEAVAKAGSYYLHIPDGNAFTPEVAAVIRENVRNGGSLIASSWSTVPLQKIFGDTNLVCAYESPKDYPLSERHAKFVREGDWCKKPWDFEKRLRRWYAPCSMLVPYAPEGQWIEYASMQSKKDENRLIPFLSALKYGEGVIILVGETLNISHFNLIDNIRRDLGVEAYANP